MKPTPQPRGLTIVETVMAMSMISVALLALMSAILASMQLIDINRQDSLVLNAVRMKMAEIEATPFGNVYGKYKSGANATFAIANVSSPPTQQVGQILFPVEGSPAHLSETSVGFPGVWPKDLNLDGDTNDTNVDSSVQVLPVKIRVVWQTVNGDRSLEYDTILTDLKN